jgi:hypothetical protein
MTKVSSKPSLFDEEPSGSTGNNHGGLLRVNKSYAQQYDERKRQEDLTRRRLIVILCKHVQSILHT